MSAKKYDQGKLRYDLIPIGAEELLAAAMTYGALVYGDHNWEGFFRESVEESVISRRRLYAALRRHLSALIDNEYQADGVDEESGLPHLAHALACVAMIASSMPYDEIDLRDIVERAERVRAARSNEPTRTSKVRPK